MATGDWLAIQDEQPKRVDHGNGLSGLNTSNTVDTANTVNTVNTGD
jgi:hypothetical protein